MLPPPTAASDAVLMPSTNGIATASILSTDRGLNVSPGASFAVGALRVWRLPNPSDIALAGKSFQYRCSRSRGDATPLRKPPLLRRNLNWRRHQKPRFNAAIAVKIAT